jgi:hemerythrin-like domain-containing protein
MQDALKETSFDGTVDWKVSVFFDWFERFAKMLHMHHDSEEVYFFPAIASRGKVEPRLLDEHKSVVKSLDELVNMRGKFQSAKSDKEKQDLANRLRSDAAALSKLVLDHLDDEEVELGKEFKKGGWKKEEWEVIAEKLQAENSIVDARWTVGAFIHHMRIWGGEEAVARFQEKMPAPVKFLMNRVFTPEYQFDYLGQIDSISANRKKSTSKEIAFKIVATLVAILLFRRILGLQRLFLFFSYLGLAYIILKLTSPFLPPIVTDLFLVVTPLLEAAFEDVFLLFGD